MPDLSHTPQDGAPVDIEELRAFALRFGQPKLDWWVPMTMHSATVLALLDWLEEALAERDALAAKVAAVRAIHQPITHDASTGWTGEPFRECRSCTGPWPCLTRQALDGSGS